MADRGFRAVLALLLAALAASAAAQAKTPRDGRTSEPVVLDASRAVGRTHDCQNYYPALSQRLNQSGDVLIGYDVEADGRLTHVRIVRSSGFALLDAAATRCVSEHWRNTPALKNGVPVASPGHDAIIRFMLEEPTLDSGALAPYASAPDSSISAPAAGMSANDTGSRDALAFFVWTLGPLAMLAWIVRWSRLWLFRARNCLSCDARNRSIVPFAAPAYCSTCGTKFLAQS